jgi:hypothetical protein
MARFGVYVAGPGIVGKLLMEYGGIESPPMLFDTVAQAQVMAEAVQLVRPYHFVRVYEYVEGDESRGRLAAHPDGYT